MDLAARVSGVRRARRGGFGLDPESFRERYEREP
jgi:hypothetical protein